MQPPNLDYTRPSSKRQSSGVKSQTQTQKPLVQPIFDFEGQNAAPATSLQWMEKPTELSQQDYAALSKVEKSYFVEEACNPKTQRNENSEYWCKPEESKMQKGISIFNSKTNFLAFFTKRDGEYKLLTYVTLTEAEQDHYLATGNFVTEDVLKSSKWRTLQSAISTPSWVSHSMSHIATPNKDNNTNTGFTQISGTFECDVEQVTPTNEHSVNNNTTSPCGQDE